MSSHRRPARKTILSAPETLEDRRVPAVVLLGTTLYIEGGSGHDSAVIASHNASQFKVTLNNVNYYVNKNDVGTIQFYGNNGNDYFWNNTSKPCLAYGGNGNDDLVGGSGVDYFYGENGTDQLWGNDGNDYLDGGTDTAWNEIYGGDGNDSLRGGNGADFLYGNDGNDNLQGRDGEDWMYGGDGADYLHGQNGNDKLDGGDDGFVDFMVGGAGNDQFQIEWANDGNGPYIKDTWFDFSPGDTQYNN